MTWVESHGGEVESFRAYIRGFDGILPEPLLYFRGGKSPIFPFDLESDQALGLLLLYCSLAQDISEARLIGFLGELCARYGTDIFRLNRLPFEDLQSLVDGSPQLRNWSLRAQAPGILRSAGDFFYRHGSPRAFLEGLQDGEQLIAHLAGEIFLMGRTSPYKNKARYFLFLLTQLPAAPGRRLWAKTRAGPLTPGHTRFMHFLGPLKKKTLLPWTDPFGRLGYFYRFFDYLFPGESFRTFLPLEAFLKRQSAGTFLCQLRMGACANCPLRTLCKVGQSQADSLPPPPA